jgi:hypothetical protein
MQQGEGKGEVLFDDGGGVGYMDGAKTVGGGARGRGSGWCQGTGGARQS